MPCFYYSPNANASTKPENIPFTEAELGAHVLHMCPLPWQDQYNMNEKGMMPMDMRLLLTSLDASALRSIATYARSMGAHIPRTTLVIVVGLRRTKRRNPVSAPLRKADIIGIP
jgi:hypothetical protein